MVWFGENGYRNVEMEATLVVITMCFQSPKLRNFLASDELFYQNDVPKKFSKIIKIQVIIS